MIINANKAKPEMSKSVIPDSTNQTVMPNTGYTLSRVTVIGDPDLVGSNIKDGVSIFGVNGTHPDVVTGNATPDNAQEMTIPEAIGKEHIIIYLVNSGYITNGTCGLYICDEECLKEHYGVNQDGYYKIGSAHSWNSNSGKAVLKNANFETVDAYSFVAW